MWGSESFIARILILCGPGDLLLDIDKIIHLICSSEAAVRSKGGILWHSVVQLKIFLVMHVGILSLFANCFTICAVFSPIIENVPWDDRLKSFNDPNLILKRH